MEGGEDVFRWSGFNQIVRQSYLMKIGIACRARCVYDNPSVRPAPGLAGRIRPMNQMLRVPREETSLRLRTTQTDRKSTRLNSSHLVISYAVFCLKKKSNLRRF